eukprot:GFUD01025758.1.p1 GENE.GFUD01025758.1~~GFUD01025758.1.p1  ORF type:complete len:120 (-),score=17.57 GFUD01025758.1:290-649(-)
MFAAHLQKASLATLTSTRVKAFGLGRAWLARSAQAQQKNPFGDNIPAGFAKIKERQKMFNVDNGLKVHERGGGKDRLLHNITLLVVLVGLGEFGRVWYTLCYPTAPCFLTKDPNNPTPF